jgi:hypothetical protein
MKISRKQLRKMIQEGFKVSPSRFGSLGPGFGGKQNSYNPYKNAGNEYCLNEEEEYPEPVEDAWAGGENLVDPVDEEKEASGESNVKEPEVYDISLNERRLRSIIRDALQGF